MAIRIRPVDFARANEVTKQTVSQWIKKGIITLGPDGLLDPVKASRELMERTNPARLRARVFKLASLPIEELRDRIKTLEGRIADLEGPLREWRDTCLSRQFLDEQAQQISTLADAVHSRFPELAQAYQDGGSAFEDLLDEIVASVFYPDESDDEPLGSLVNEAEKSAPTVAADEAEKESSLEDQ